MAPDFDQTRRQFIRTAAAGAGSLALSACGGANAPAGSSPPSADANAPAGSNAPSADATAPAASSPPPALAGGSVPVNEAPVASDVTMPAWRRAMTVSNRLYKVGSAVPDDANASLTFPGGVRPYGFGTAGNEGWDVMSGYSSGTIIEDVGGSYGTFVFGTGGHTRIQNQILSLSISNDSPSFGWWQQPYFQTSPANGAELYWDTTAFSALPASRKTGSATFGGPDEITATPVWLSAGGFAQGPMGYEGWIFPAKLQYGDLGNNNPHGFRFSMPSYIPPAMTGTGAGAFIIVQAAQGPFAQSYRPGTSALSDMMNDAFIYSTGIRKFPIHLKNTQTGTWSKLSSFCPNIAPVSFYGHVSAVAKDQKRVYYSTDKAGGTAGWWYIDFTNGVAGATVSAWIQPSTPVAPNRGCTGAFTAGHPTGRHLWFWPDLLNPNGLICQDLDAGTQYQLNIGQGLSIASNEEVGIQYDAANNRILLVQTGMSYASRTFLNYRTITIPSDTTNAAAYVVSPQITLSIDASVPQPLNVITWLYSKAKYHPGLGVMFIPQDRGPMLAFHPA